MHRQKGAGPRLIVIDGKRRTIKLKFDVKISIESLDDTENDLLMMTLKFQVYVI